MKKLWAKFLGLAVFSLMMLPSIASAAAKAANIVIVADTRNLGGIIGWWANLYNESHLYFAILTVVLIPVIGVCFGLIADVVMGHIGIDLKSRELAEH